MHPVIFKISFAEVRSYYLLWASALLVFVYFTRHRAVKLYGIADDDAISILRWVYVAGIVGAFAGSVIERLPLFIAGQITASVLFHGMSSWGGFLAGGVVGMWQLRKRRVSICDFAEATSVPATAMIAVGRIGCLLEGCCQGVGRRYASAPVWAVHMSYDPADYFRIPTQLIESLAALAIMFLLLAVEKFFKKAKKSAGAAVEFPLFMVIYSIYRLISDRFREVPSAVSMVPKTLMWCAVAAAGLVWLWRSLGGHLRKKP